jgi:hypothetical protein
VVPQFVSELLACNWINCWVLRLDEFMNHLTN